MSVKTNAIIRIGGQFFEYGKWVKQNHSNYPMMDEKVELILFNENVQGTSLFMRYSTAMNFSEVQDLLQVQNAVYQTTRFSLTMSDKPITMIRVNGKYYEYTKWVKEDHLHSSNTNEKVEIVVFDENVQGKSVFMKHSTAATNFQEVQDLLNVQNTKQNPQTDVKESPQGTTPKYFCRNCKVFHPLGVTGKNNGTEKQNQSAGSTPEKDNKAASECKESNETRDGKHPMETNDSNDDPIKTHLNGLISNAFQGRNGQMSELLSLLNSIPMIEKDIIKEGRKKRILTISKAIRAVIGNIAKTQCTELKVTKERQLVIPALSFVNACKICIITLDVFEKYNATSNMFDSEDEKKYVVCITSIFKRTFGMHKEHFETITTESEDIENETKKLKDFADSQSISVEMFEKAIQECTKDLSEEMVRDILFASGKMDARLRLLKCFTSETAKHYPQRWIFTFIDGYRRIKGVEE